MHCDKRLAGLAILLGLGLTACGGDSGPAASDTTMDATQATQIGATASTLISGAANSVGLFSLDDGTLTDPTLAPGVTTRRRTTILSLVRFGARMNPGVAAAPVDGGLINCTPTQSDTADADADGIFDDNTLTFTTTNCSYVNQFGVAVTVTGSIRIRDAGTIYGFIVDFTNLHYNLVGQVGSGTLTVNGSYSSSVNAQGATVAENLHIHTAAGTASGADGTTDWTLTFTPTDAIALDATRLPAGEFSIAGGATYARDSHHWALVLATAQPLVYDGVCASDPPFTSGTIEGQISSARSHGFRVQFNGCGTAATYSALGATT